MAPGEAPNQALTGSKPQRRYQADATAVDAATPANSSMAETGQSSTRWASSGVTWLPRTMPITAKNTLRSDSGTSTFTPLADTSRFATKGPSIQASGSPEM